MASGEHLSKESTVARKHTVYVMRAGERMDRMFPNWWADCFQPDKNGKVQYTLTDLNMPVRLPKRSDGPAGFQFDTPLTEFGNLQAQLIGRTLRQRSIVIESVYCSPALRCIQSAGALLSAAKSDVRARLEPALADALAYNAKGTMPKYLSVTELTAYGYPLEVGYTPVMTMGKLNELMEGEPQTPEDDYRRVANAANALCRYKLADRMGGCTVIVAHAHTVDSFARTLLGLPVPRRFRAANAHWLGLRYPYGSMVPLQGGQGGTWLPAAERPPVLTYMDQCSAVDWEFLNRTV